MFRINIAIFALQIIYQEESTMIAVLHKDGLLVISYSTPRYIVTSFEIGGIVVVMWFKRLDLDRA